MRAFYSFYRFIAKRWFYLAGLLFLATFFFTLLAFPMVPWSDCLYQSLRYCILETAESPVDRWEVKAASWFGASVWSLTIVTVLVGIFSERTLTLFVSLLARNHVIVCGLGTSREDRQSLVRSLCRAGRNVVVLESNPHHPGLDACRDAGALCLVGAGEESTSLKRARLSKAAAVIALGSDNQRNLEVLTTAAKLLGNGEETACTNALDEQPLENRTSGVVNCLLQIDEPSLVEALGQHRLCTQASDRLHARWFSVHEMVARAMLRETMLKTKASSLNRILIVGVGRLGRFGESLAMRAIKDSYLEKVQRDGKPAAASSEDLALEIHVLDRDADQWARCLTERAAYLYNFHGIFPLDMPASRCGFGGTSNWAGVAQENYDAIFVCLSDESLAISQATRIANALDAGSRTATPIIVRVSKERSGLGVLYDGAQMRNQFPNIRTIGTRDRIYDVAASMNPTVEMVAQVLHQDYLSLTQEIIRNANPDHAAVIKNKPAVRPWTQLDEKYRHANRSLARRLANLLTVPESASGRSRRFRMEFAPAEVIDPAAAYVLSDDEIETLAQVEHALWMKEQAGLGWIKGDPAKQSEAPRGKTYNENMVPWGELQSEAREYDRNIVRRLPVVLAKADYKLVEVV